MNGKYQFRKLTPAEAPEMFRLIMERVAWMDEVGIRQWNVTKYDECYPQAYYAEHAAAGRVFCLTEASADHAATGDATDSPGDLILAVGLLLEEDERWPDTSDVSGVEASDTDGGEQRSANGGEQRGAERSADGAVILPANAYYLHHFATRVDAPKGVGGVFLQALEEYAAAQGKDWFRLDSADGNEKLDAYYTGRGYEPAGTCVDGLYYGILRQKKLK